MERMESITNRRNILGNRLGRQIVDIPGVRSHEVAAEAFPTYWFYLMRLEDGAFSVDREEFVKALQAKGVAAASGYIPMPLYQYEVFQNQNFFGGQWPMRDLGLTAMDYREVSCPEAEAILKTCVYIRIHEGLPEAYVDGVANAIRKVAYRYAQS